MMSPRCKFAIRQKFVVPPAAPAKNEFVHKQMIAHQQRAFHGLGRNLERLHDKTGSKQRQNHGHQQRFQIFGNSRLVRVRIGLAVGRSSSDGPRASAVGASSRRQRCSGVNVSSGIRPDLFLCLGFRSVCCSFSSALPRRFLFRFFFCAAFGAGHALALHPHLDHETFSDDPARFLPPAGTPPVGRLGLAEIPATRSCGQIQRCARHLHSPAQTPSSSAIPAPGPARHPGKLRPPRLQKHRQEARAYRVRPFFPRLVPAADIHPSPGRARQFPANER